MKNNWIFKFLLSCIVSAIIACAIIVAPIFFIYLDNKSDAYIPGSHESPLAAKETQADAANKNKYKDDIAVFSSNSCMKRTYYVSHNGVKLYSNIGEAASDITILNMDDELVADEEKNGYIYCETNHINSKGALINGWVKKDSRDLKGIVFKSSRLIVDVNLTSQTLNMYKDNILLNNSPIKCSSGIRGSTDTETPLGIFTVKDKFKNLTSEKYNENLMYAVKFLGNYLIHSVPIDEIKKDGKIKYVEDTEAINELGKAASHGCIRLSLEDAKKVFDLVNTGDLVYIHY